MTTDFESEAISEALQCITSADLSHWGLDRIDCALAYKVRTTARAWTKLADRFDEMEGNQQRPWSYERAPLSASDPVHRLIRDLQWVRTAMIRQTEEPKHLVMLSDVITVLKKHLAYLTY